MFTITRELVSQYAQMELGNQSMTLATNLVNHVTTNVPYVKMEQALTVKNVLKITTCMNHHVSLVLNVKTTMLTIVMPPQTNVYLVKNNVHLVLVLQTIVMNVKNQELTPQFVIAQPVHSMMD
jgi:hypothetical protein